MKLYMLLPGGGIKLVTDGSGLKNETIRQTEVGSTTVSTVFLSLDHGRPGGKPVLFETMIFNETAERIMDRYSTLVEAKIGHEGWVNLLTDSLAKGEGS